MPKFTADLDNEALRHLLEALLESGQAISIYDAEDRLRYANKTYQNLFLGDFEGPFTFSDILRYGARTGTGVRIDDDVEALIARTLPRRRSVPHKSFVTDFVDGRWFWIDHTVLPNGWLLTVGADITSLKHDERTLRQAHEAALVASRTDVLTGLPNRRYILELLDEFLGDEASRATSLCVALIDLDHFKAINDLHGHDVGDVVLKHFSIVCRKRLGPEAHVGRTGGEEFLVLLPSVGLSGAIEIIGRLRADFPTARSEDGTIEVAYTFSAGVAEVSPGDTKSSVLMKADRALYAAKNDGRNCTRVN